MMFGRSVQNIPICASCGEEAPFYLRAPELVGNPVVCTKCVFKKLLDREQQYDPSWYNPNWKK
jgi:hypothetical protein